MLVKIAVIGSRELHVEDLGCYIPEGTVEIVSGGARGIYTQQAAEADYVCS